MLKGLSLFLSLSFALPPALAIPKPKACPSVAMLKAQGFVKSQLFRGTKTYVAVNTSHYGTQDKWTLIMWGIEAKNEKDALDIANDYLKTMNGNPEPQSDRNEKSWACLYNVKYYVTMAVTPGKDLPQDIKKPL